MPNPAFLTLQQSYPSSLLWYSSQSSSFLVYSSKDIPVHFFVPVHSPLLFLPIIAKLSQYTSLLQFSVRLFSYIAAKLFQYTSFLLEQQSYPTTLLCYSFQSTSFLIYNSNIIPVHFFVTALSPLLFLSIIAKLSQYTSLFQFSVLFFSVRAAKLSQCTFFKLKSAKIWNLKKLSIVSANKIKFTNLPSTIQN